FSRTNQISPKAQWMTFPQFGGLNMKRKAANQKS
ncbi:uncharacterized protein METZ01_LOCUS316516, partial [marine metagenome]